jgi:2-methylfumaryl-CoA hydratase
MTTERIAVGSPWFEDLERGQVFDDAPAVTLTAGHAAFHEAAYADRLRLPLDAELSRAVTGEDPTLANPNLVCNVAIGQTTVPSGRVIGNLFYRGLVLQRPVHIGDTLRTTTTIAALRQNRPKPGRPATGLAVFEMHVENQRGETVLHFWRCPMLPCRDPAADTGHADSFDAVASELDLERVRQAVPSHWNLARFRDRLPGMHFADVPDGATFAIEARDTVTLAPEIARLTLNVAAAHTDAGASAHGRRLVYGGHTISLAASQVSRALPNLLTFVAWRSCDHTAPVFEGDILRSELRIEAKHPLPDRGGLLDLRVQVHAERAPDAPQAGEEVQVLDWRALGWMA